MLYHLLFCSPITDLIWKGTVSLLHSYPVRFPGSQLVRTRESVAGARKHRAKTGVVWRRTRPVPP